jgi:hypothetical protein
MDFLPANVPSNPYRANKAMRVENHTPFLGAPIVVLDKDGAEQLILTLKATYDIAETGGLEISKEQQPLRLVDQFQGKPGISSIRYAAEIGPPNPTTDIALVGSAVATRPDVTSIDVGLRVGSISKWVRVFGERQWKKGLLGLTLSSPMPIERVPLIYENAFGGQDDSAANQKHHARESRNPVGRGFKAKKSTLDFAGKPGPNIEDPEKLLHHPGEVVKPQGFGFIGRDWEPRAKYCGTYDEHWLANRIPLLPLDFDERFYHAAHPDLIAPAPLNGGENVEVVGCSRSGRLLFALPRLKPAVMVSGSVLAESAQMKMDTVLIETHALKLSLIFKAVIKIHHRLMNVRLIEFRLGS